MNMRNIHGENKLKVEQVDIGPLNPATYNPRFWSEDATKNLIRLKVVKELGYAKMPVVYINIPDIDKEKELNLRLNKNVGEWNYEILKEFDETILSDIGFKKHLL